MPFLNWEVKDSILYVRNERVGILNKEVNFKTNTAQVKKKRKEVDSRVVWHFGKILACGAVGPRFDSRQGILESRFCVLRNDT